MKNETKTFSEYKAPKCKEVALIPGTCINQASLNSVRKAEEDEYGDY